MQVRGIDHIGIAVPDDEEARAVLEGVFGFEPPVTEVVEEQGVRTLIYHVGETKVELLLPLEGDGPIAKHLDKRGPGLHHIAFEVHDLEAAMDHAEGQGLELVDTEPRSGVEGSRIAFLHPKGTFGTLVELVEFPDDPGAVGGP